MVGERLLFKKGDVVVHKESSKKGIIIDWGLFHPEFRRFHFTNTEQADSIRVWTSGGAIEIWDMQQTALNALGETAESPA